MPRVKRVVLIVVLVGVACLAGVFFYLRTCCAPPPTSARDNAAAAKPAAAGAASPPVASTAPAAPVAPDSDRAAARAAKPAKSAPTRIAAAPETAVAPATASLRVVSDIPGAQVFLNREFVGAAPATANDLKPGSYQLNVAAPGYDNHIETIELAVGEREIVVKFREVRLNATLEVVHKHRLGSCKGQLIATPQGLRYETTDKDDAFTVSLLDLEMFQVDYLEKNLRVQPRRGKRYDFTDPAGNADRLFVFHRDVDRARTQLKKEGRAQS
jgi:PEGA domain